MNKLPLICFIMLLGLSLTVPVLAADGSRAPQGSQDPVPTAPQELSRPTADPGPEPTGFGQAQTLNRGSRIIGKVVESRDGTKLGEIFDLLLDTERGCIAYVAVSTQSFGESDERLRAVPWSALRLDSEKEQYTLDIDAAAWTKAPAFRQHQWPRADNRKWLDRMYQFYAGESYSHAESP